MFAVAFAGMAIVGCQAQRNLDLVRTMGDRHAANGEYERALVDYQEYIARKPDGVDVRYSMARALLGAGRPQEAREQFYQCLAVKPDNEDYAQGLADALLACNEREELITFLTTQARERGRSGDYLRLGRAHFSLGNADEAKNAMITAAKLDGGRSVKPHLELADLYRTLGDSKAELNRLRMALFIEPRNPEIQRRIRELGEIPGPSFVLPPE